jgi:hypothetical protein
LRLKLSVRDVVGRRAERLPLCMHTFMKACGPSASTRQLEGSGSSSASQSGVQPEHFAAVRHRQVQHHRVGVPSGTSMWQRTPVGENVSSALPSSS